MKPNKKAKRPKLDKAFLEKLMNDLLRPLGICLCYGPVKSDFQNIWRGLYSSSDSWFFKALESGGVCKCSYEAIWIYVMHSKIEYMLYEIQNKIEYFGCPIQSRESPYFLDSIKNPYIGMTLEELCIKRDLL